MSAVGQVPSHAAATALGMRAPDGVSAWRRVFDREQLAALDRFRAVAAPEGVSSTSPAFAAPLSQSRRDASAPPASTRAGRVASPALAPPGATPAPTPAAAAPLSRSMQTAVSPCSCPAAGTRLSTPGTRSCVPAEGSEAGSALWFSALLERWPSRRLHSMTGADGLHLWLRDAAVSPEDPALQRWLGEVKRMLADSGTPLASFTMNGKECLVPTIVN